MAAACVAIAGSLAAGWWTIGSSSATSRVLSAAAAPILPTPAASTPASTDDTTAQALDAAAHADPIPAAAAAYARGDMASALLGYQRAMSDHPDDARAINNLAQVLVRLGRASEAIPLLEKAVALDAGAWSYRFNLARARTQVRDWVRAVEDYKVAERLMPDDGPTLFNLGLALQQTGADAEAVEVSQRAAAQMPDDPSVVLAIARSYQRLAKRPEARAAFERYLAMAPQSADAAAARQALAALDGPPAPQAHEAPPADGAGRPVLPPSPTQG